MATSNTTPVSTTISPDSQDDVSQFISVITAAFSETALTTAFICAIDSTPPPYPSPLIDSPRRQRHFSQGILDSTASGAEIVQAGNWSAIALWETPSYQGKTFIDSKATPPALLGEWRSRVKQAKTRWLASPSTSTSTSSISGDSSSNSPSETPEKESDAVQLRPFYHLSFLARNPAADRVPGSINAVISPFLERAKAEGVPAWLEATTLQAVNVYQHYGFRIAEVITVGKGKVDAMGWPKEDGEGVIAWAMIFNDHCEG